jgi:alginate O-acetyltransferase complex protein AlgI
MLFNSLAFLFLYAPISIAGFYLLGTHSPRKALIWLGGMSLVFYSVWYPLHTVILLVSIVANFFAGILISRAEPDALFSRKRVMLLAVGLNLLALCYYKYFGFFGNMAASAFNLPVTISAIALPLGISFFTFTQIAYLVDTCEGKVREHDFTRYLLFVTYFPHLVAGPIIHHKDVMTQFAQPATFRFNDVNFSLGCAIFIIGLFKKVAIADNISTLVAPVFDLGEIGAPLGQATAWAGALAYTAQLYFDFSGYSDMAIGLSMMLNVRLPFNFNSPYKSRSIVEFWRRWHISLSTFLRDYLYIPLGGNRFGNRRRYINMGITMVLGGLWHGASWTFIVWGALHGSYLAINHFWREHLPPSPFFRSRWFSGFGWILTLLAVIVGWAVFRAQTMGGALRMLGAMSGLAASSEQPVLLASGVTMNLGLAFAAIAVLMAITMWAPNSQQIAARLLRNPDTFLHWERGAPVDAGVWDPVPFARTLAFGVLLGAAMMCISRPSQFLYFNF